MKYNLFVLVAIICFATGCDPMDFRDCPAYSYDQSQWLPNEGNETITFTTIDNEKLVFNLVETYFSDTFSETINGEGINNNPENVTCQLNGTFTYQAEESGIGLQIRFTQLERLGQPIGEQVVLYEVGFRAEQEPGFIGHEIQIEPTISRSNNPGMETFTLFDSLTLNNQKYFDVVQSERDTTSVNIKGKFIFWKIFVSKGTGIVHIIDTQGKEYFLEE